MSKAGGVITPPTCGEPARIDPVLASPNFPGFGCADASEVVPTPASFAGGQLIGAFNSSDPRFLGMDEVNFGYSFDGLGQSWNLTNMDAEQQPLTIPLCSGSPVCANQVWEGDGWAITDTVSGRDLVFGLESGDDAMSFNTSTIGVASLAWEPGSAGGGRVGPATPFWESPLTPIERDAMGAADGPKAAFDPATGIVAYADATAFVAPGSTFVHLLGGSAGGGCDGDPGGPSCAELACENMTPGTSGDLACSADRTPGVGGSREDSAWATHVPVVAFGNDVWVGYMKEDPSNPTEPLPVLAGFNVATGSYLRYDLVGDVVLPANPGSIFPCPSRKALPGNPNTCLPDCYETSGAATSYPIRLGQHPALAVGEIPPPPGSPAGFIPHHLLYMAWHAADRELVPHEFIWLVTVEIDDNAGWPPAFLPHPTAVTYNFGHDAYFPALAADPGSESVALIYENNGPCLGDCPTNACAAEVIACTSDDGGGAGPLLGDVTAPGHCEAISSAFEIEPRRPGLGDGYVNDYLGAAHAFDGKFIGTWVQSVNDPAACVAVADPLIGVDVGSTGFESQGWSNSVDPPKVQGCDAAEALAKADCIRFTDPTDRESCQASAEEAGRECRKEADAILKTQKDRLMGAHVGRSPVVPSLVLPAAPILPAPSTPAGALDGACASSTACAADHGYSCVQGVCECSGADSLCGSDCVNIEADPLNCGGCGRSCAAKEVCNGGRCE